MTTEETEIEIVIEIGIETEGEVVAGADRGQEVNREALVKSCTLILLDHLEIMKVKNKILCY